MAIDLFSLVLNEIGSWAFGRMLDAAVNCLRCGYTADRSVTNNTTSQLACPSCQYGLDQHTNATGNTVNRHGAVAAAYISNVHWNSWGGFWEPRFNPHFAVNCVNSRYEDLVVRCTLSRFQSSVFYQDETILRPQYERNHWNDVWWKIDPSNFPQGKGTFAIDLEVFNTWGDKFHSVRSLGNYSR